MWWMLLERDGQPAIRTSTGVPVDGGTLFQTKQNKILAEEVYAKRKADLVRARERLPAGPKPSQTFRAYAAWYLAHVSPTKRNLAREKSMINSSLVPGFGRLELDALTKQDAQEWMTGRLKDVKANTVRRELELLKSILSSAIPTYLDEHPLKGFPGKGQLRIVEPEPRILTPKEETRLLKALTDPQDYALIVCALDTLMRLSDVVNLERRADHGQHITVLDPKTKTYKVPVSTRLRTALNKLAKTPELATSPWVFPKFHRWTPYKAPRVRRGEETQRKGRAKDRSGSRSAQLAVIRMFDEACAAADIPHGRAEHGVTFHSLRHTGASRALEAGADVRTVQELGGWTSLKQLTRYTHPTDAAKRRAVNLIGKRRKGAT